MIMVTKIISPAKFTLILITTLVAIDCRSLYYIKNSQPLEFYQCFKKTGLDSIMLPLLSTKSGLQEDSIRNILDAKSAGLDVQITFIPCRSRTATQELQLIAQNLKPNTISRFWGYPLSSQSECSWGNFPNDSNCKYLQTLINTAQKKYGIELNVVTDKKSWAQLFNSIGGCSSVSNSLLWWIPTDQQTNSLPNFNSYEQIGGWKIPDMKLSNTDSICGEEALEIYYA